MSGPGNDGMVVDGGQYDLSFAGHLAGSARCVCVDDDDGFVAATVEGVVSVFTRASARDWTRRAPFGEQRMHGQNPGLLLAITKRKQGAFVSGGTDNRAAIWSAAGGRLGQLVGAHSKPVNSVVQLPNDDIITGSQDGSAVVWRKQQPHYRLEGHEYGVEVAALDSGEIVTGSGNRSQGIIRIWSGSTCVDQNDSAHSHIIRKLIRHPLGFASCGNDGFVKVWTAGPPMSCILSVLAHPAAADIDSFVYSIAYIESTGSIVSVGEDRYARIIAGDGTIVQSIKHPAAVRDVDVLPNSDIVTACSDGAIRVWSRSSERHADDSTRNAYHELLAVTETAAMQTLDPSQLRPASVLQAAGEHPGQVVIVDLPNKGPTVFQWDQDASTWQEVGAELGAASKPTLDGVQYDHVVDVVAREGAPPIKLGFNVTDDPSAVARAFCTRYGFGEDVLPQIVDYLKPLANAAARLAKQEQETAKSVKLIPCWKHEGFMIDSKLVTKPLETKLLQLSESLPAGYSQFALSDDQKNTLSSLVGLLESCRAGSRLPFAPDMASLIESLLVSWPIDNLLPVIDLLRMLAAVHPDAVRLFEQPRVLDRIVEVATGGSPTHLAVTFKALSNWIAKRGNPNSGPTGTDNSRSVLVTIEKVVSKLSVGASHENPAVVAEFTAFAHNILCYIGRYYQQEASNERNTLFVAIIRALSQFFQAPRKERATFTALLVVGTIASLSPSGADLVRSEFADRLSSILSGLEASSNPLIRQAARDVTVVMS
ncbi:unnamed protein product (mitochondrion) [Plasmodiophora brassicae]|uniref:Phospholipase A-2-activating protein n=1 Tax=Plasmodiophora brassicae TaxID=37360 RepID=A0A3P3YK26_PLABS|nr:unnamed protein product [Plasmodiophora brassicae]